MRRVGVGADNSTKKSEAEVRLEKKVKDLEAKNKQLKAENAALLAENEQLKKAAQ